MGSDQNNAGRRGPTRRSVGAGVVVFLAMMVIVWLALVGGPSGLLRIRDLSGAMAACSLIVILPVVVIWGGVRWSKDWAVDRRDERQWRLENQKCTECGYDLRTQPDRCPECGAPRERWWA